MHSMQSKPGFKGQTTTQTSTPASNEALEVLMLLAKTCEQDGYPLQAIHCLQALLQASNSLTSATEARARLNLGRLLLKYTTNCKDAYKALLRAQTLAQGLYGSTSLRCEICSQLARYFQSQGEVANQVQMYDQALKLCAEGSAGSDGPQLLRWQVQLHLDKAHALISDGEYVMGLGAINAGLSCSSIYSTNGSQQAVASSSDNNLADVQILLHLSALQLHMVTDNIQGFQHTESAIETLLQYLQQQHPSQQQQSRQAIDLSGFLPVAQLHLRLLQALQLLVQGCIEQLNGWAPPPHGHATHNNTPVSPKGPSRADTQPGPVSELQRLADIASTSHTHAGYDWLAPQLIQALIHIIAAMLYLHKNRFKQSNAQVDAGSAAVMALLNNNMGLDINTAHEHGLDPVSLMECRPPLAMYVQLQLIKCTALMASCELKAAQQHIMSVINLVQRFSCVLHNIMFPLHLLIGQYCTATGELRQAQHHFQAVKQNSQARQRVNTLASALLAMSYLEDPSLERQKAVQLAIDALDPSLYAQYQQVNLEKPSNDSSMGTLEGVVAQLACALVKLKLDQSQDARLLLSQCLAQSHKQLQHYSLVSQIMVLMAPLQAAQGDVPGAHGLTDSSSLLARSHPWILAQVQEAMSQLYSSSSTTAEKSQQAAQQAAKTRHDISQAVAAAKLTAEHQHQAILAWGLRQEGC